MSELPPDGSSAALEKKRRVEADFVSADFGTPLIDDAATRSSLPAVAAEITPQVGNSLIVTVPSQFLARSAFESNRFTSPFDLQPGDAKPVRSQDYKDVRTAAAAVTGERLSAVVPVTASDVIKPIAVDNVAVVRAVESNQAKSYVPSETVQTASAQRTIDPAVMQRTIDPALMQTLRADQTAWRTDQPVFAPVSASADLRQPDSRLLETGTLKNPAAVNFAVDQSVDRQQTLQPLPQIAVSEIPRGMLAKPQDIPTLDAPVSAERVTSYATRSDLIAAFNRDPSPQTLSPQILTRTEPQTSITSYKQDFKQDFNPGFVPNKFESSQDGMIASKRAIIDQPNLDFETSRLASATMGVSSKPYDDLMKLRVDVPPNSIIGTAKGEQNRDFTMVATEARTSRVPDASLQVSSTDVRALVDRQQLQATLDSRTLAERSQQPSTLDARAITEARTQQQVTLDAKLPAGQNTLAAAGFESKVQQQQNPLTTQMSSEIRQQTASFVASNLVRVSDQPTNVSLALAKPPVSDIAIAATPRTVLAIADKSLPQTITAGTATITAPTALKVASAGEKVSATERLLATAASSNVVATPATVRNDRATATPAPLPLPPQLSDRLASLIGERPVARLQTGDMLTTRASVPVALTTQLHVLPTERIAASLPAANGNKLLTVDATGLADRARLTPTNSTFNVTSATGERALNVTTATTLGSKLASLVPDRTAMTMPTTGERNQLTALPANANGININVTDRAIIRTAGPVVGERATATFVASSERSMKGLDLGHGTTHGSNQMPAGDRTAAAAASITGRSIGRELGLAADIRNGALPEKGQIQFGLASDKVVPLGGKLIAFKPLHEISEHDKRYLLGIELAIGAVALAAVARARATEGREGAEEEEEKDGDEQVASNSDDYDTNVIQRPKHLVQPGETLQTIAEEYYADANLAWLLLALNKGKLSESWNGDVCYVEVAGRQELELPVREDISGFYRSTSHKFKGKRLVTTVRQSTMDQELVTLAFRNVVGHPTRQLQSASS